jgi:uncharacterized protein YndB with AHSA1/START domain
MNFQSYQDVILWRLHLKSPPSAVYQMLSTDEGRAAFWAESAAGADGILRFRFPNALTWQGKVLIDESPSRYQVEYFGGSVTTFNLESDGQGGTDLMLMDEGVSKEHRGEVIAGWVSVLMALKAAVDFSVDLRNHDPQRTWDQGYIDN